LYNTNVQINIENKIIEKNGGGAQSTTGVIEPNVSAKLRLNAV